MDYEKAYKRLHKFIGDLYPYMSEYCKEKVEGFFPELKESEDERIRKEAIAIIKQYNIICEREGDKCWTADKVISWLEKQGEQKTHWKPTSQQLGVLQTAMRDYGDGREYYILESLYDDLKKL